MNIEELEMTVSKKRHELHEAAEAWMQFSQARQEKIEHIQETIHLIAIGDLVVSRKYFYSLAAQLNSLNKELFKSISIMKLMIYKYSTLSDMLLSMKMKAGIPVDPPRDTPLLDNLKLELLGIEKRTIN